MPFFAFLNQIWFWINLQLRRQRGGTEDFRLNPSSIPAVQLCMKIHKLCLFDSQVPFSTKLPSNMAINIQFSWSFHFCFVIQISFRLICSFISMHKMPWIPQHCKYLPSFSPAGRAQGLHCPAQCTDWDFVNSYTDTVTLEKNPLKPSLIKSKQDHQKVKKKVDIEVFRIWATKTHFDFQKCWRF